MKVLSRLILFIIILGVVAFFASPYYKLYTLKTAYDKGDYTPIIAAVNFEQLRPNLKEQLQNKVDNTLADNAQLVGMAKLLGADEGKLRNFAMGYIDNAVDKAITADNLTALVHGDVTKDSEPLLAGLALAGGLVDMGKLASDFMATGDLNQAVSKQKTAIAKKALSATGTPEKPELSYCGLNCFSVATRIKDKPVSIILHRHNGFDWQIDNVVLP